MLHEKAHLFFALLNQMYKIDAEEKLHLITIAGTPYMKNQNRKNIIDSYKRTASDIIDILDDNDDYSGIDLLKKNLTN